MGNAVAKEKSNRKSQLRRGASAEVAEGSGINRVRLVGMIASASSSRAGTLTRRIEIPGAQAREVIDLECEKGENSSIFRKLRINQWVEIDGRIRRRYWRAGSTLVSRTYVEVRRIQPR